MKTLILLFAVIALLSFTPRSTPAQTCCGQPEAYRVDCTEDCGQIVIYSCIEKASDTWMVVVTVQCGSGAYCNRVGTWAMAGYCADGVAIPSSTYRNSSSASVEAIAYVNAYVTDCTGRFVAVRMAFDRDLT